MAYKMLVDLDRCVGCWTCSMACKVYNELPDDEFWITVKTNGSGAGIDRPQGIYPNLRMSWEPIYKKNCNWCARRTAEGLPTMCEYDCPTEALAFGDDSDPESRYSQALARVTDMHKHVFMKPAYDDTRDGVTYATRA